MTDILMPRVGEQVMAEWLRVDDPNVKILLTSGYSNDPLAQGEGLGVGMAFMPKPYTPAILARRVRAVLDETVSQPVPG